MLDSKKVKGGEEYLVKWRGLGYAHSTWETRADLENDKVGAGEGVVSKVEGAIRMTQGVVFGHPVKGARITLCAIVVSRAGWGRGWSGGSISGLMEGLLAVLSSYFGCTLHRLT